MNKTQINKIYWMPNASFKRLVFNLFLKTLVSGMVRSSVGREIIGKLLSITIQFIIYAFARLRIEQ